MDTKDTKTALENLKTEIDKLEKKDFNVYFFVLDTKGNPSGTLDYIYNNALILHEMGYKVTMLHQESEFVGVGGWLGEKYAALPHANVEKSNVDISPADFLFVPEIYANVMSQTKNLACKKIVMLTNMDYLTSTIPVGVGWGDMDYMEAIVNTETNAKQINEYFPYVKTHIVHPCISDKFKASEKPQKLMINMLFNEQEDINKVMKSFYWKYPIYKWVSFRDVRNIPQDVLPDVLNDACMTIWCDDKTNFGSSLIAALKSKTIVLAKVPNNLSDWMVENDQLVEGPIWVDNLNMLPEMIASIIRTWTLDEIPAELYNNMDKYNEMFTYEKMKEDVQREYVDGLFSKRLEEFKNGYNFFNKNNDEKKDVE